MSYHVFAGYSYYPSGGPLDHVNTFNTQEAAVAWVEAEHSSRYDWWYVCESETLAIVAENDVSS